jgi:HD superfamily phosphohydrolase
MPYANENLIQDTVHGYIPITVDSERPIIDSVWMQRLRQIHQLQTAWFVYPTAEHTRFQHCVGAMHLAGRMVRHLYPSLAETCGEQLPSYGYVVSLMRVAALLHDVGHGPFGHFFDSHFSSGYGLNHERIGAKIIVDELGELIRNVRTNPDGQLEPNETLSPEQVAVLIVRPSASDGGVPRWLKLLRSLFSGLYTVDNMDFVLRDAFMTGFSRHAFDIERLIHYTFFTEHGLTIHQKGFTTLVQFITIRAELFRSVYFHRTVRAIDLALADLFKASKHLIFNGNPLEHLNDYRRFTEFSLLVDVASWDKSDNADKRRLFGAWEKFLNRQIQWYLAAETTAVSEQSDKLYPSIFDSGETFETAIRQALPPEQRDIEMRVDIAKHLQVPGSKTAVAGQNFLYDSQTDSVRRLEEAELFQHIPQSYRICRLYTPQPDKNRTIAKALEKIVHPNQQDDATNM